MFSRKNNRNQSGQALVETILIILVSIGLVTAMTMRLFQPFKKWAEFYLGAYVECLLDLGELPALGDENGMDGECNQKFEPFSVAEGRPPKKQTSQIGSNQNPPADQNRISSQLGRRGSGNRQAQGGSSRGSDGKEKSEKETKVAEVNDDKKGLSGSFGGPMESTATPGSVQIIQMEQLSEAERRKVQRRQRGSTTTLGQVETDGQDGRKSLVIPPKGKKADVVDDEVEPWSFGKIFRIAFIIGILAILIFLIGSQIRQVQKSIEKN